jgi:hypothetical protein
MKPAMSDLVDALPPGSVRVPLSQGDQDQSRLGSLLIGGKDGTPSTSRPREIQLDAASEARPVMTFRFAAQEPAKGRALVAELLYDRLDLRPPRVRAPSKVLDKDLFDDPDLEARNCARAQGP